MSCRHPRHARCASAIDGGASGGCIGVVGAMSGGGVEYSGVPRLPHRILEVGSTSTVVGLFLARFRVPR